MEGIAAVIVLLLLYLVQTAGLKPESAFFCLVLFAIPLPAIIAFWRQHPQRWEITFWSILGLLRPVRCWYWAYMTATEKLPATSLPLAPAQSHAANFNVVPVH